MSNLAKKQTDKQTEVKTTSFGEGNELAFERFPMMFQQPAHSSTLHTKPSAIFCCIEH